MKLTNKDESVRFSFSIAAVADHIKFSDLKQKERIHLQLWESGVQNEFYEAKIYALAGLVISGRS